SGRRSLTKRGRWTERAVFPVRSQGRPDAGALPRFLRRSQRGRVAVEPHDLAGISGAHTFVSLSHRAGPIRLERQALSPAHGAWRDAPLGGVEPRSAGDNGAPTAGDASAPLPQDSRQPVSVLLSHGPQTRRGEELVHPSYRRTPAADGRARRGGTSL